MTTSKQTAANRRNAKKSTGPKSREGKSVSKYNALRHGLLAREAVLPDEDADAFDDLHRRLMEDLVPESELEYRLVDRAASCLWRLQRVGKVEAGIFVMREERYERAQRSTASGTNRLPLHMRSEVARVLKMDEADVNNFAYDVYEEIVDPEKRDLRVLGESFVDDAKYGDAFGKLSRYEASIERSFYSALHELQRLQKARKSGEEATPVVVDGSVESEPDTST